MRTIFKSIPTALIWIFLFAFLLRLIWFFVILTKNPAGFMLYDSWGYWRIAENLNEYGIFSQGNANTLIPDSTRTPLYPLFIYFLNKLSIGFYGIIIVQILLSTIICALAAFVSGQIFNNKKAGIITGIITALDFPSVFSPIP